MAVFCLPNVCPNRIPSNEYITKQAEEKSINTKGLDRKMSKEDQIINLKKLGSVPLLGN